MRFSSTRFFSTQNIASPKDGVDWSNLGFKLNRTEWMYKSETEVGTPFDLGKIVPYGGISLEPAATVLNYGQGAFEGMKVTRRPDGSCVLFRPDRNHNRMSNGCERLMMSPIPKEVFFDGVAKTTLANSQWIPPVGSGALYLRPLIIGTGASLGVAPSQWYHFLVYACPVGSYFKKGAATVDLLVSDTFHRAAPKGVGNTKSISNYAPAFHAQHQAKSQGYSEALFLCTNDKYVEEAGAANVFCVGKDGVLRTPNLGSILPGVTRESIIQLARDMGMTVEEAPLHVDTLMDCSEMFAAGTAAVITPVNSVTYKGKKASFNPNISLKIKEKYLAILEGTETDKHGWCVSPSQLLK